MSGRRGTPPEPNAAVFLIALGRRAAARVDEALAAHRITYRHLSALGHLAADSGISYSELARRASVTTQSIQATVTHLEDLGAVERAGGTGQGTRARLVVTASGRALLEAATTAVGEVERDLLGPLDTAQRDELRTLLLGLFAPGRKEK